MTCPRVTATRRLEWDSAHRVLRHESKCSTLHGHRYAAELTCEAPELDVVGRVIDFGVVKQIVGGWIDANWDHTTLVNWEDRRLWEFVSGESLVYGKRSPFPFKCEPTAENIAIHLLGTSNALLAEFGISVVRVRVYETPNCYAEARP